MALDMIKNIVGYDSLQYKSSYYNLLFDLKFLKFDELCDSKEHYYDFSTPEGHTTTV
jgi:hypothetical protein